MLPDLIRTPNHLGDLVMALPALAAAPAADVVVAAWLAPLLELLPRQGAVIPLRRGSTSMLRMARSLRCRRYSYGVLLPPSFSSALLFRLGGVRQVRGSSTDRRGLLLSDALPRERLKDRHRTLLYMELVTGQMPVAAAPRLPVPAETMASWQRLFHAVAGSAAVPAGGGPVVGVFPGSNAVSRRWDPERFAGVAQGLAELGARVLVFGSAGEADLTRAVAGRSGLDLGGRTDLPILAAALSGCDILVTNDSGPMHLAAAVGTPTLVVSGPADTKETAPGGTGHVYLQRLDLPCVPCVRNECPRSGAGFILPESERECLRLIEVPEVLTAARSMLRL
jgi:lipopolysaccharide heptosyltransferase II